MRERFSTLPDDARIFRLVELEGRFLPEGARLPLPEWLEPTTEDKAEGQRRSRPPGVSVWDDALTTPAQACAFRTATGRPAAFGFECRSVRATAQEYERTVEVLADPLGTDTDQRPGREGHSLVEGLQRPAGLARHDHKKFLAALIDRCVPVPEGSWGELCAAESP